MSADHRLPALTPLAGFTLLALAGVVGPLLLANSSLAQVTTIPGGGSKRTDCMAQLLASGTPFPAGKSHPRGVTCADGDICDQDGERNGVCEFSTSLCVNTPNEALGRCKTTFEVTRTKLRGGVDQGFMDQLEQALALPSATQDCTPSIPLTVAVQGPNKQGEFKSLKVKLRLTASARHGLEDTDKYQFVCRPAAAVPPEDEPEPPPIPPTPPSPVPPATPGAGLAAEILAATTSADGAVKVTFRLTDDDGMRIEPTGESTSDPTEARLRFTIARLEVDPQTVEGFTTTFTRYVSYITARQTSQITGDSSDQPTFDSGGTFALVDAEAGTYRYTFATKLPAGFPATLTHTIGAQVERTAQGETLVANPIFDFVPAGGSVVTMREVTTTAQCNSCHDPLSLHGGGRREVRLCQLCHTDQAFDPDTGNTIDLRTMVHKIHRGKELPSVEEGPVGTRYLIIGRQGNEHVYGEKVHVCAGGEHASKPCESDADCPGGTCTGEATAGVGFPQDIRNCQVCHADGATAENHTTLPSTAACATCHDDVNPSETATEAGAPGTGHLAGAQPEAFCRLCHTPEGEEFGISVAGAHTVPARSTQLAGLEAEILSASGAPGGPVTITFHLSEGDGTPLTSLSGLGSLSAAMSGPTTDLGGGSVPLLRPTIPRTLASPTGTYTHTLSGNLPADATGTWRIGLEARRAVALAGLDGTVNEAAQNPVLDFSVDGSPVSPRREVVDIANCGNCHGTFSKDFSIHGNLRNQSDYCVICHNANVTDFARRGGAVTGSGASPVNAAIHFKWMIHKIHTGEELENKPYIIYGFGPTAHDFSEVLFPGDRRNCATCHVNESYLLPLPDGVLPTVESVVDTSTMPPQEVATGSKPPTQAACLSCHDADAVRIHAETQTTASGDEACLVCHGEGKIAAVSEVHATAP